MKRRARPRAWAMAVLALGACKSAAPDGGAPTAVRLGVAYDEAWGLTSLEVSARDRSETVEARHEVLLLVPDEWANEALAIEAWGLRGGERAARGETEVVPERGREVAADVALAALPCGAWCTEGATQCAGDGVQACEQRDEDPCMEWSVAVACPDAAPYCSLGLCAATCVDECADGEARCEGPGTLRLCGQADSDDCRDWLPALACAKGEACSNGACAEACADECEKGAAVCAGGGVSSCGDLNLDGCREWGPVVPCAEGESCSGGACAKGCDDDCSASACAGLLWTQCAQFDFDDCLDASPGTSCVPSDPCLEGACDDGDGCSSAPLVCESPPDNECIDDSTWRAYDTAGLCEDGACDYGYTDIDCPSCPDCDPCAGVTCDDPPSACYASSGTCEDGSCDYAYADGADCSDANACTTGDACASGVCSGTPAPCTTPPGPECADSTTLRTFTSPGTCSGGSCTYPYSDFTCAGGCSGGACDSCIGVTCTSPPSVCYTSPGTCSGGTCSYGYDDGASCTDGDGCTTGDTCNSGVCAGADVTCTTPSGSECVDSSTLRTYSSPGTCSGGTCSYPYTDSICPDCPSCDPCAGVMCTMPASVCYASPGTCSGGTCSYPYADGVSCADGDFCDGAEECLSGACAPGAAPCAADALSCTTTCNETLDACNTVDAGFCAVGGACYATGAANPANACQECIPATSQTAFTNDDTNACSDGDLCTTGDACSGGSCTGTPVTCTTPPAPTCVSGTALRTYTSPGTCSGGTCDYPYGDTTCAGSCSGGACIGGTCAVPFSMPAGGGTYTGTTSGASANTGACGGFSAPEHVYSWTPSTSGVATVSTCGSALDTVVYLHQTTCATGAEVGCNDEGCATGNGSLITLCVTAGTTYYLFVDGWSGASGSYTLTVTAPAATADCGSWVATSTSGAPAARARPTAVWAEDCDATAGAQPCMIVWGGFNASGDVATGGRYFPATGTWTATTTTGAPSGRSGHTAVWTGSEMIVWGGYGATLLSDGGRYNPVANSWTATPAGGPSARWFHTAVWSGSDMILWGGDTGSGTYTNTGGRYIAAADAWAVTATLDAPSARGSHTALWAGGVDCDPVSGGVQDCMIVWGGAATGSPVATGGRYVPGWGWIATSTTGAPSARADHEAVFDGSEMIVWAGQGSGGEVNTGGVYDPVANSWTSTATSGAPEERDAATSVWTGTRAIFWGGRSAAAAALETGGLYDPGADSWLPTATLDAPSARYLHAAVWTGSEMIVWGGCNSDCDGYYATGGRFTPP